ncbi:MAG TPA: hypothetical protein GX513_10540 [Firmicutes bacterium]|nr:hypothetical protein [Bacillota bacterium]
MAGALAFPTLHLILSGSAAGALAYLLSVVVAEALAVAGTTALAEFFYTGLLRQAEGVIHNLARVLYTLVWLLPSVGIFLFFNFQAAIGRAIMQGLLVSPRLAEVLAFVYPFPFGYLVAAASGVPGMGAGLWGRAAAAALVYAGLALRALRWTSGRLRARALGPTTAYGRQQRIPTHFRIRPVAPWLGVLVKDMRLVFRSPSEMSMFLMPAAAIVPMAISVAGKGGSAPLVAMGIMAGIAFFSLFAMPALLGVEVEASSYARSLPVRTRWILGAKSAVTTAMYVTSMFIMVVIAILVRRARPEVFLAFGLSGTFPALAGALVAAMLLRGSGARTTRRVSAYASPLALLQMALVSSVVVILPVVVTTTVSLLGPGALPGSGPLLPVPWPGALWVHLAVGVLEAVAALLGLLTRR